MRSCVVGRRTVHSYCTAVLRRTRVVAMTMKKREDVVTDGFCADDILKNAPKVDDHYFVVPKIVE